MHRASAGAALFVPWPQPLALGLVLGVALAGALPHRAALVAGVALFVAALMRQWLTRVPWPTALDLRRPRLWSGFVLPVILGLACGMVRLALHEEGQPGLPADLLGQPVQWQGHSDGAVLSATQPVRTRLALVAPRGGWPGAKAPVGRLTVVGVAEPAPGMRNPGGFDHAAYLRRRGVSAQLFVDEYGVMPRPTARHRVRRGVAAGLEPTHAALMAAMTLGLRDDLGQLRDTFGAAGMAHLLALSGLHVGVLLLAVERAVRRVPRGRIPLLMLVAVGFVALVGPSPSVVRAVTMALAALASRAFGAGRVQPWTALALAVLVGLSHAPQMLFDLSFQLSYLAVAGMLLLLPHWLPRLGLTGAANATPGRDGAAAVAAPELAALTAASWRRGAVWARHTALSGLAVSTAAQLPSLTLVLSSFGVLPVLSPLVNVVAVPLAGLLVPLGFLAGLVGLVSEPLAGVVNLATKPLVAALVGLADLGANLPLLSWGQVSWLGHSCWAAFMLALGAWAALPGRARHTLLVGLVAGGVAWAVPAADQPPDVWYLDVGQGDAVVIRLGGGDALLVDGGGSPFSDFDVGARIVLPALRALGVTRLTAVIATHPDADHIEGLLPVLASLPVGALVMGPPDDATTLDGQLRELAVQRGVNVHETRRGELLSVAGGRAVLQVLNPSADAAGPVNERSVAFVLHYRGVARALFLGDLGVATEPDLAVPPVNGLMVPHHGSRGSTSEGLLQAASPDWAVISVGRNQYGHPAPQVLERLAAAGVKVFTTQLHGAVRYDLARPATQPVAWHK